MNAKNPQTSFLVTNNKQSVNLAEPTLLSLKDFQPQCQWSSWSKWSECAITCGNHPGQRKRIRSQRGSKLCSGKAETENKKCPSINKCAVDCHIGPWSDWSDCSQSCGRGQRIRTRDIVTDALFGGLKCSQKENDFTEAQACTVNNCSVDGNWSDWSRWSYCDKPCGKGVRLRRRNCDSPKPENGGADCLGMLILALCLQGGRLGNLTVWDFNDMHYSFRAESKVRRMPTRTGNLSTCKFCIRN